MDDKQQKIHELFDRLDNNFQNLFKKRNSIGKEAFLYFIKKLREEIDEIYEESDENYIRW